MLADFGDLKTIMTTHVHDVLDHGFIYYKDDPWAVKTFQTKIGAFWEGATEEEAKASLEDFTFKAINVPFIPTAENLARWCWDQMVEPVEQMGFGLVLVELWETPTSLATFARY
jgi:6-pyruvoyl-tetrahydropterin synthase